MYSWDAHSSAWSKFEDIAKAHCSATASATTYNWTRACGGQRDKAMWERDCDAFQLELGLTGFYWSMLYDPEFMMTCQIRRTAKSYGKLLEQFM